MANMLRLFVAAGLVAFAILVIAIGLARNTAALQAPVHLILFIVLVAAYVLPTVLALYRGCAATGWIAALNILLGKTLFGWGCGSWLGSWWKDRYRTSFDTRTTSSAHPGTLRG